MCGPQPSYSDDWGLNKWKHIWSKVDNYENKCKDIASERNKGA